MRELDCLNILRLLYVWLWHLADELHAGGRGALRCAALRAAMSRALAILAVRNLACVERKAAGEGQRPCFHKRAGSRRWGLCCAAPAAGVSSRRGCQTPGCSLSSTWLPCASSLLRPCSPRAGRVRRAGAARPQALRLLERRPPGMAAHGARQQPAQHAGCRGGCGAVHAWGAAGRTRPQGVCVCGGGPSRAARTSAGTVCCLAAAVLLLLAGRCCCRPGVSYAMITLLQAAWSAQLEQKRGEAAARRARQQGEAKRDRQEQRLLLQQSPQAAKGQSLALSGRRLSALGAGGATYVRPKLSPSPASARHVSAAAAAAAAGARGLALDARMAGAAGGSQPAAARGSQPGAAAGGGAKQPARPAQQQQQRAPQQQQRAPQQQQQQRQQQQQPRPQQQPHKPPPQQQQQQQGDVLSQMWRTAFADRAQATVAAGAAAGQRPVAPGAAADRGGPADARRSATTPHQQQAAAAGGVPPDVRRSVAAAESRSASTGALAGRKRPAPAAAPPAAAEPPAAAAAAAEGNERAAKVPRLGPNPVHPLAGKGEERRRVASSKLQAMLRASKKG